MLRDDERYGEQDKNSFWASYSDLFMLLSFVFLLMYVTSSLKNGTHQIKSHLEKQRLAKLNVDLQKQVQVFNAIKDGYLEERATDNERRVYAELMDQLKLLADDTKKERQELEKQAAQNRSKERALNHYQQIVRNIINSNYMAKAKIQKRNELLGKKNKEIHSKSKRISSLNQVLVKKEKELEISKAKISKVEKELDQRIKDLDSQYKLNNISKMQYLAQMKRLRRQAASKISRLQKKNREVQTELEQVAANLRQTTTELDSARQKIKKGETDRENLVKQLASSKAGYLTRINQLKQQTAGSIAREKQKYLSEIKKHKMSAKEKQDRHQKFRALAQQKEKELKTKVDALNEKVTQANKQMDLAKKNKAKYIRRLTDLNKKADRLSKDLNRAKELIDARKKITQQIKRNLASAGINAEINEDTGDVILSFGDDYFDTGRADLTNNMIHSLKKFVPAYSKSLFENPEVAKKLSSVEIVGFASPTYKGKYIDPSSLNPDDRKAVNYNLDLSYRRARSIFNYMFDTTKMVYGHQRDLLPIVKVTGRSFLADSIKGRNIASGVGMGEYCRKYNCKKSQKVIIRFELEN